MIKNPLTYGVIAVTLFLTSCSSNVFFEDPMPRQEQVQARIPTHFQGTWVDEEGDKWIVQSDGILMDDEFMKSDSKTQIRTDKDHIYLNLREEEGWTLYVSQVEDDVMDVYTIDINDDRLFRKLARVTDLEITYAEDGARKQVRLNPSNREFRKMVKRKLFSYQGSLTRL